MAKATATTTEATTPTVGVTVSTTIDAPKPLVDAIKKGITADINQRKQAFHVARAVRAVGIDAEKKGIKEGELRSIIAASIAAARGLKIEQVLATEKNGGDKNAYQQLSQLYKIARPAEGKEEEVDRLLAKDESEVTYTEVLKAAQKSREGRRNGNGENDGDKGAKPFDAMAFANGINELVNKALAVEMPIKDIEDITAKVISQIKSRLA